MPANFLLDARCFDLYVLGAGFSFVLKRTCELCARIQISYLEMPESFWGWIFKLCKVGPEEPLLSGWFLPIIKVKASWILYPAPHVPQGLSALVVGTGTIPGPCKLQEWPHQPLPDYSLALGSLITHINWLGCRSPELLLYAVLFSLVLWAANSSCLDLQ